MDELRKSLNEYNEQLSLVNHSLANTQDGSEKESLLALKSELQLLIQLTQESLDAATPAAGNTLESAKSEESKTEIDDEYALFMQEMAKTGAYDEDSSSGQDKKELLDENQPENNEDSDIEDELSTLLGMKCAVYHTHRWGGQPSLHNAMVSAVLPRQDDDHFKDLQVSVLFTHPTHAEMLPCPYYLDGECKFDDEKCRYSHGKIVQLSSLKDAVEPNFEGIKMGSRILLKLKPPKDEDITVAKKSTEKYLLWHRAIVLSVDFEKMLCIARLESGVKTGEKRKLAADEYHVSFEDILPLNVECDDSGSDDSLSDTEYSESQVDYSQPGCSQQLVADNIPQHIGRPMGEWERHTRGIGSKLMLAMGYVPGTGLGASSDGRVQPVEARVLPQGKSLDHCMEISNRATDPLKVEKKLRKLQKREEDRNKRAYEREKEKERRNVFNFLNRTLGDQSGEQEPSKVPSMDVKQSTTKALNIEQFKITEDTKKLERELIHLNNSIAKYPSGSDDHRHRQLNIQITEKERELSLLKKREKQISQEQDHRKNKQKMLF